MSGRTSSDEEGNGEGDDKPMSCDDMYVCEKGIQLLSCRIKITMGKCDRFSTVQGYEEFMKKKETTT